MKNARNKSGLEFKRVAIGTLPKELSVDAESILEATKELAKAKSDFEAAFIAEARKKKMITAKETLKFGYKFGGIAVAVAEVEERKTSNRDEFSF